MIHNYIFGALSILLIALYLYVERNHRIGARACEAAIRESGRDWVMCWRLGVHFNKVDSARNQKCVLLICVGVSGLIAVL